MSNKESWEAYYRPKDMHSFGEHLDGYLGALHIASRSNPMLLSGEEPKTFVLGGYYPHSSTQYDFVEFCRAIRDPQTIERSRGNSKLLQRPKTAMAENDRYILLDMNEYPLSVSYNELFPQDVPQPAKVQADLKSLPFDKTVDLLFIDHTFLFIPPDSDTPSTNELHNRESVPSLSSSLADALTENGLVIVINKPPLVTAWARWKESRANKREVYPKKDRDIVKILSGNLKLVAHGDSNYQGRFGTYSTLSFARKDSVYPEHTGSPYVFPAGE